MTEQRPEYHFTPPSGWMNDPNGLVWHQGEYHLFYQLVADGDLSSGRLCWGHAVSPDLVSWTHLEPALLPHHELGVVYSGSAVEACRPEAAGLRAASGPGLIAIFTHAGGIDGTQKQSLAWSEDRGRTWTLHPANPVIPNPGLKDFRDPRVFRHDSTGLWVMLVAAGRHIHFYISGDLVSWELSSRFGPAPVPEGAAWECPELLELPIGDRPGETRWILKVDLDRGGPGLGSISCWYPGGFDGRSFHSDLALEQPLRPDFGRDFYAAQAWSSMAPGDTRRVWLAWMNNWSYARLAPTRGYQGAMTLPRELSLEHREQGLCLIQQPIRELERLRREQLVRTDNLALDGVVQFPIPGRSLELWVELTAGEAETLGLRLGTGPDRGAELTWDCRAETLSLDRAGRLSHPDFQAVQVAPLEPGLRALELRIFLDSTSVEVFALGGALVMTATIYPPTEVAVLELFALGGAATVSELEVWKLGFPPGPSGIDLSGGGR